jgi:hypothetical protein
VLELFTYARIVLGFHANPAGGLEDLNIDSIYCYWVDGFAARLRPIY